METDRSQLPTIPPRVVLFLFTYTYWVWNIVWPAYLELTWSSGCGWCCAIHSYFLYCCGVNCNRFCNVFFFPFYFLYDVLEVAPAGLLLYVFSLRLNRKYMCFFTLLYLIEKTGIICQRQVPCHRSKQKVFVPFSPTSVSLLGSAWCK